VHIARDRTAQPQTPAVPPPDATKPDVAQPSRIEVHLLGAQPVATVQPQPAQPINVQVVQPQAQPALPQAPTAVQYAQEAQPQEAEMEEPNGVMTKVLLVPATAMQPCMPTEPQPCPVTPAAPVPPPPPPCMPAPAQTVEPCSLIAPVPVPEVDEVVQLPNGQLQTVQVPAPSQAQPQPQPKVQSHVPVVCDVGETMCTEAMTAGGNNCIAGTCTPCTSQVVAMGVQCLPAVKATGSPVAAAPVGPLATLPPGVDPKKVEKILNNLQGSVSNLIGDIRQRAQNSAAVPGSASSPTKLQPPSGASTQGWPARAVQNVQAGQMQHVMPGYST